MLRLVGRCSLGARQIRRYGLPAMKSLVKGASDNGSSLKQNSSIKPSHIGREPGGSTKRLDIDPTLSLFIDYLGISNYDKGLTSMGFIVKVETAIACLGNLSQEETPYKTTVQLLGMRRLEGFCLNSVFEQMIWPRSWNRFFHRVQTLPSQL